MKSNTWINETHKTHCHILAWPISIPVLMSLTTSSARCTRILPQVVSPYSPFCRSEVASILPPFTRLPVYALTLGGPSLWAHGYQWLCAAMVSPAWAIAERYPFRIPGTMKCAVCALAYAPVLRCFTTIHANAISSTSLTSATPPVGSVRIAVSVLEATSCAVLCVPSSPT